MADRDDDSDEFGTVIVAIIQKERRKKKKEGFDLLTIGYSIYKVVCLFDEKLNNS